MSHALVILSEAKDLLVRRFVIATLAVCTLAGGPPLQAQERAPIWLVAKSDTVLVYLTRTRQAGGFVVYRAPVTAATQRVKRTAEPIVRVREPGAAAGILGADLPLVMRATRAADEVEMLRRLTNDRFAGDMLTGLSRNAASVLGRVYIDGGVTPGAEYEYRVVLTDRSGAETDSVYTARVRVADITPVPPTNLRSRVGDGETQLTWSFPDYRGDARDLVLGFHVYRAEANGQWRRLTVTPVVRDNANAPEFLDSEARTGSSFRYQVTSVDIAGRESTPVATALAVVRDQTAPSMPADIVLREGEGTVGISWRIAPEPDAAGYHIERAAGTAENFARITRTMIPVHSPEWVDTVPGARRFFYRIIIVDAAGNASDPSNPISAVARDKSAPPAPTNVLARAANRRVTVRWNAVSVRDLRGYYVYRGDTPEHLVKLTDVPITGTQFVDSGYSQRGLRPGANYIVELSAVDSSFNESPRARATISIVDDEAPAAATTFSVKNVLGRHVELTWSTSTALDVASYEVTRAVVGGVRDSLVQLGRFDPKVRVTRDTTVVSPRRYVYRLIPIDKAGNRGAAVTDTVEFRDFIPPSPPRVVAARSAPTGSAVTVTWQRVVATELAGYNVYRSAVPTGVFEKLTTAPVATLTFTDRNGKTDWFYMVRAVDRAGNESDKSPVVAVIRP